jgi:hypothetical protein
MSLDILLVKFVPPMVPKVRLASIGVKIPECLHSMAGARNRDIVLITLLVPELLRTRASGLMVAACMQVHSNTHLAGRTIPRSPIHASSTATLHTTPRLLV